MLPSFKGCVLASVYAEDGSLWKIYQSMCGSFVVTKLKNDEHEPFEIQYLLTVHQVAQFFGLSDAAKELYAEAAQYYWQFSNYQTKYTLD